MLIIVDNSENAEQRYEDDVVDMKMSKDIQRRSLSTQRGRRRVRPQNDGETQQKLIVVQQLAS
jgi:hypothetical protein